MPLCNSLTLEPMLLSSGQLPNWYFALCCLNSLRISFFFHFLFFNLVSARSYLHHKAQHLALTAFLAAFPQPFVGGELLWLGSSEHMWKVKLTIQNFNSRWGRLLWRTGESERQKWNKCIFSPHTSPIFLRGLNGDAFQIQNDYMPELAASTHWFTQLILTLFTHLPTHSFIYSFISLNISWHLVL